MTFTVRDLRNIGKTCLISARLRPAIVGHTTRVINNRTTYLALIDVDIALRLVKPTKMGRPRTKVEWYKKLEKAIKEYRNGVTTQTKLASLDVYSAVSPISVISRLQIPC